MNYKSLIYGMILLLFLVFSTTRISAKPSDLLPKWEVNEGDSMIYTYTKYYCSEDGDGNPNTYILSVITEHNETVNLTIKKGLEIKVEILYLGEIDPGGGFWGLVTLQGTYGNIVLKKSNITVDGLLMGAIVHPTVDNQSYWEERITEHDPSITNMSIEGASIIFEEKSENHLWREEWNWKSGWVTSHILSVTNSSDVVYECEISTNTARTTSGFKISSFSLFILFSIIIIARKRLY
ncbi:MAG: hypothetical protein ACW97Z_03555 [Candidatus Hodarchaeales archaeon]